MTATTTLPRLEPASEEPPQEWAPAERRPAKELSRRRFTIAVVAGTAIVVPALLWLLWDLWSGTVDPLRGVQYDNFYDLQARAMFHGHLWLPPGKMGVEAFIHDGRQYTYFGIFPSLIRMPVLLVTSSLDGKLTAPSMLLAWLATAFFTALLLWRLRILIRGNALVGRAEAASYGALMAAIMGGSVVLYLVATPFIYNEDFAWSIPLTIGSVFALLGMMERPSWGNVVLAGVLVTSADLDRTPTGYACVIVALLVAGWLALGKGGAAGRRWAAPVVGVAVIGFLANAAVTYAKFGIPVGLPMSEQVWASVNAHRRYFLAANGGRAFSPTFLPSTLWAYFQPFGIRFSWLFPFITPPGAPAAALNGVVLDQLYPTASATPTMPLLVGLGIWGVVTAFRRRGPGLVRFTRILLVAALAGSSGVLLWGYISQRYLADLMPLVILASSIGMIDLWRRLDGRRHTTRKWFLGAICVLAVYGVAANVAVSAYPVSPWTETQAAGYVTTSRLLSIGSVGADTLTGPTLPYWAPAGELFAVNHCSALYLSTGDDFSKDPGQQIQHYTWLPVERSPNLTKTVGFTFNRPERYMRQAVPLLSYGATTLDLVPDVPGSVRIVLEHSGTPDKWPPADSWSIPIRYLHAQYQAVVTIDPYMDSLTVTWYGEKMIGHYVAGRGPSVVHSTPISPAGGAQPVVMVADVPMAPTSMSLCHSLVGKR